MTIVLDVLSWIMIFLFAFTLYYRMYRDYFYHHGPIRALFVAVGVATLFLIAIALHWR